MRNCWVCLIHGCGDDGGVDEDDGGDDDGYGASRTMEIGLELEQEN